MNDYQVWVEHEHAPSGTTIQKWIVGRIGWPPAGRFDDYESAVDFAEAMSMAREKRLSGG